MFAFLPLYQPGSIAADTRCPESQLSTLYTATKDSPHEHLSH